MRSLNMFPLPLVVFESEVIRLHIYEPRYLRLIEDCKLYQTTFGIPTVLRSKVMTTGTEMELVSIEFVHPTGELDIVCKALGRFEYKREFYSENSLGLASATVDELPFFDNTDKELNFRIYDLLNEMYHITEIAPPPGFNDLLDLNNVLHKSGMSLEQEYEVASLQYMVDRQLYLIQHLKTLISTMSEIKRMKEIIGLNGHYKKLPQSN